MLYVLLFLVISMVFLSGALFAMLKCQKAQHNADMAALKLCNMRLSRKLERISKMEGYDHD